MQYRTQLILLKWNMKCFLDSLYHIGRVKKPVLTHH